MRMWLRQATLTLGSNQYTLDGLNFSFKVQFEDRAKVSTAQLEVYNLSPSTRASLKKGDAVIITAGYKGDVGCIFVGGIVFGQQQIIGIRYVFNDLDTHVIDHLNNVFYLI